MFELGLVPARSTVMAQAIHQRRPKPVSTRTGELIRALVRVQILLARRDYEMIWTVAEAAIEGENGRH